MNIKEFEYIVEIARQESISKAASRLYLSQPTLTKFLKKIEDEFETPLFDRVGKKMILTAAGKCCVKKAEEILELNEQMNKQIQALRKSDSGFIRIGTSASRGEYFINRVLNQLMEEYPHLTIHLTVEAKADLQKKLENDELDVIFVSNYAERPYLDYTKIAQEEMVLVVPEHHPLMQKAVCREHFRYPYVALEDWIHCRFIVAHSRLTTGQYTKLLFQHYGQQPPIAMELGSLQLIYSAVQKGIGISIAPSMPLFQTEHQGLKYLSFEDEQNIQWYFSAITKRCISLPPAVKRLIAITKEAYSEGPE